MNGREFTLPALIQQRNSLDGIQYLRGIAAMMVVYHHAPHGSGGILHGSDFGAIGVEIFFVISGFIMAYTTRDFASNKWEQVLTFFKKRLIRVVPLYWLALAYMAMPMVMNYGPNLDLLKDFFFIPHFSQRHAGQIYPILVPGWTLNYEMFFYLLFGLAMFAGRYSLLIVLAILVALWIAGQLIATTSAAATFYTRPDVLWFGLGIIVYWLYSRNTEKQWPQAFALFVIIIGFALLALENHEYGLLLRAVASACVVYAAVTAFRDWRCRPLEILGAASFSIYLFHVPSLPISSWLTNYLGLSVDDSWQAIAILSVYLAVGGSVGIILHIIVERPVLDWLGTTFLRKKTPNKPSLSSR